MIFKINFFHTACLYIGSHLFSMYSILGVDFLSFLFILQSNSNTITQSKGSHDITGNKYVHFIS